MLYRIVMPKTHLPFALSRVGMFCLSASPAVGGGIAPEPDHSKDHL